MKKIRLAIRIAAVVLSMLTVVSITLLIFNDHSALDTTYEIISFSMGIGGVALAIVSQVDSYHQEKRFDRISKELNELMGESDAQSNSDKSIKRKLAELEELEEKILRQVKK